MRYLRSVRSHVLFYAVPLMRTRLAEIVVVLSAIMVRIAAMMSLQSTPYVRHPLVDAYPYWSQASSLAKKHSYSFRDVKDDREYN